VFLSYARGDDEAFVRRLRDDLTRAGFGVWFDRVDLPSRQLTFHQEIQDAIRNAADRLIHVAGPAAAVSEYVRGEWQCALALDKPVLPILRLGDFALVPEQLSLLHCEDFRGDTDYDAMLGRLVANLKRPSPPLGALFAVPSLPPNYLVRRDLVARLKAALQVDLQKPLVLSGAPRVGVQGMGGIGKSVLAAALARDGAVRRGFPDGVLWVSVGQHPNLPALLRDVAQHLGKRDVVETVAQGQGLVRAALQDRAVLLVLDDVWRAADAAAFDVLGARSRALVTTRDARILQTLGGELYAIELLDDAEALQLLADGVGLAPSALPEVAHAVVQECAGLPLALALCAGMAKERSWPRILERLRHADLEHVADLQSVNPDHRSIWRAMQVSVDPEFLEPEKKVRFAELAVFVADRRVPEAAIATLWAETSSASSADTEDLLIELAGRSLVRIDSRASQNGEERERWVWMHDLLRDFASVLAGDARAQHERLLRAYARRCPGGRWWQGPADGYFFERLLRHLVLAERLEEARALLLDYSWLRAKLGTCGVEPLLLDYQELEAAPRESAELLAGALRLSSHVLGPRPEELAGQLISRLFDCGLPAIQTVLREARRSIAPRGLVARRRGLAAPGGPLVRRLEGHQRAIQAVALSADGTLLASASEDKTVKVWHVPSGTCIRTLEGHAHYVNAVAVSADGRLVASGSNDRTVKLWHASSGVCIRTLTGHVAPVRGAIHALAFSADTKLLVSGADDKTLKLWEVATGTLLHTLEGHTHTIWAAALSHDGKLLVSGSIDRTVRMWDVEHGALVRTVDAFQGLSSTHAWVDAVALSANGKLLASNGNHQGSIRLWDVTTGQLITSLEGHRAQVICLALSADGRTLVSGSKDDTVKVWDTARAKLVGSFEHERWVQDVALSADGKTLVSACRETLQVWQGTSAARGGTLAANESSFVAMALSADGKRLVTKSSAGLIEVWNGPGGERLCAIEAKDAIALTLGLTGKRLVASTYGGDIQVWNTENGSLVRTLSPPCKIMTTWFRALALAGDDEDVLVSGSDDKSLRQWNVEAGKLIASFGGHHSRIDRVAVSADGKTVASCSFEREVKIWQLGSSRGPVHTLWSKQGSTMALALSTNGETLVVGHSGPALEVWNARTGKQSNMLEGHEDEVHSVALSADGKTVASGSNDKTLRVWDLERGHCLACFTGDASFQQVAIAPGAQWVIALDALGRLHEFELVADELQARAAEAALPS
jgi:WD40 repeat protein